MKIAFFSPFQFSKTLGATKNRIELAEGLNQLGWQTFLIDNFQLGLTNASEFDKIKYSEALKNYLIENAHLYDVVIYEYDTLPFDRKIFFANTLLIARPALLTLSQRNIYYPMNVKSRIRNVLMQFKKILISSKANEEKSLNDRKLYSLKQADIIQVQNHSDANFLVQMGYAESGILIIPNGLTEERLRLFNKVNPDFNGTVKIAFVGTFDFRKGAMDFKNIIGAVAKKYPDCVFKLLGARGLFNTEAAIRNFFPKHLHKNIEIVMKFDPVALPGLLEDCQLGIFPTYHESFGFGALEMMCAGLPVVSYSAQGPSDFILKELLVPVGRKDILSKKVLELLSDKKLISEYGQRARVAANNYSWIKIAEKASAFYKKQHEQRITECAE